MIKIVKYTDIHKAIVERIKSKYPNVVFSKDIEKAIIRPSFFIDFDNIKANDFMREAQDNNITVRIYYFSTNKDSNHIELLNMQDELIELFLENNLIVVNKDVSFEIDEVDLNIIDKVLHCYFDISISENYGRVKSNLPHGGNVVINPATGEIIYPSDKELMEEIIQKKE